MTNKEKYREFCKEEKNIPIFSKDWWLDCVCGEKNWDVALVEKGGQVVASMPFFLTNRFIFSIVTMPKLTQNMGPFIKYPSGQYYYKKLSWEKEIIELLINQIPKFDYFIQNFNYKLDNWLPFYWKGFQQSTKYTYIIENKRYNDIEKELFNESRRRRIKKARKQDIEIFESNDIRLFYKLNMKTFIRQGIKIPYSFNYVEKLYKTCSINNAVKILFAKYNEEIVATSFLVFDDKTVYYLMGGIEPSKSNLGAMDLIHFESIKFAMENNYDFDFEGSMIENIEHYFRSFGSIQKPYFQITKIKSKILKLRNFINELKND
ncbi:GNAT family N-acetyltransferase [Halarcobacter sp.]|uniref:GNAT family N-acetyltransferase n=1 Tax=Halarcobacter sp. TaxID=2321133 RepID=UPI002AAAC7A3|nr:GNAT family N-acetyltransferase [Halarcobacter sp.]